MKDMQPGGCFSPSSKSTVEPDYNCPVTKDEVETLRVQRIVERVIEEHGETLKKLADD